MKIELSKPQLLAILSALDCEIPTRHAAAFNDLDERIEPMNKDAIDWEVPAMEEARYLIRRKLGLGG